MSAHQRYLEAPYDNAARQEAAFEKWCEVNDVEFDAPDAWDRFEQAEQDAYEAWADDAAESRAQDRAERDW